MSFPVTRSCRSRRHGLSLDLTASYRLPIPGTPQPGRMAKPIPSRTTNPLHFVDLEPHRFEDLVRQLIHDLRNWVEIEALGRSGADEGIDIRALEAHYEPRDAPADDEPPPEPVLRPWFMQVKREKSIGPTNAENIADEVTAADGTPFGALLAAPANFSKKAREAFKARLLDKGVTEVHVWGFSQFVRRRAHHDDLVDRIIVRVDLNPDD